ncbi:cytochrome P450 [Streptosporangium soli]|nr:cytochrome P450 [Streptosporangium sp. KLBMP 9127]MCG5220783.1 cytochrome P450 [Streptosporangium sp. KLBMP 9127]
MRLQDAGITLIDPTAYADDARLHEACTVLRRESPVHWVEGGNYRPFWAVTRHADVLEIERQHQLFLNAPRPLLAAISTEEQMIATGVRLRTLVHIDDPDHQVFRAIGADWFKPAAMRRMQARIDVLAKRYVDRMMDFSGECDFAADIAAHYPLYVILSLLGLPESDFPRMLTLTQELFGGADPHRRRGDTAEAQLSVLVDFLAYFQDLTASRRAHPTDDLASAIANAGLNDLDTASYYVIIATAGHDTTSSTIAGGLHALMEHPDQLARLRENPSLMPAAVDEMIRWVTPVKEFMRTATTDYELRGVTVRQGDSLLLCYPSANRDEDVFDDPFRFDVGRTPNRHLAFGFGAHYCLGAAMARMEVRALFTELLSRLTSVEAAGDPQWVATTFVGGLKHLPIRYEMT